VRQGNAALHSGQAKELFLVNKPCLDRMPHRHPAESSTATVQPEATSFTYESVRHVAAGE
jgi:hypothetical protein